MCASVTGPTTIVSVCQHLFGEHLDQAISQLLIDTVTPLALEVTLTLQQEIQAKLEEVDRLRKKQVQRSRYEADLAQRRYLHVDPANRLVADSLEADWNSKLRALNAAQEQYEEQRKMDRAAVSEQQRASIMALAHELSTAVAESEDAGPRAKAVGAASAGRRDAYPKRADHGPRSIQGRNHENTDGAATSQLLANKNDTSRSSGRNRPSAGSTHRDRDRRDSQRTRHPFWGRQAL
jgi:hypothetical protein